MRVRPYRACRVCAPVLLLLLTGIAVAAGPSGETPLSIEDSRPRNVPLNRGWVFAPGDNPAWADPNLDDSSWQKAADPAFVSGLPENWARIGWFRLHVDVAADLAAERLVLQLRHPGASEVFLDGQLLHSFGTIGETPTSYTPFDPKTPPPVISLTPGSHVFAVRYAYDPASADARRPAAAARPGITCWLDVEETAGFSYAAMSSVAFAGLLLGIGLANLLFFAVDRWRTANAALAGYALAVAALAVVSLLLPDGEKGSLELRAAYDVSAAIACAAFVSFFSAAMRERIPSEVWIFTLIWIAAQVTFIYIPLPSQFSVTPSALYLAGYAGACAALYFARNRLDESDRGDLSYLVPVMVVGALAPVVFYARRYVPEYQVHFAAVASLLALASLLIPTVVLVARILRKVDQLEDELHDVAIRSSIVGSR